MHNIYLYMNHIEECTDGDVYFINEEKLLFLFSFVAHT